ncbi:S8 family serine peptidase [Candidatus Neomarinimicrobiota bacterium]
MLHERVALLIISGLVGMLGAADESKIHSTTLELGRREGGDVRVWVFFVNPNQSSEIPVEWIDSLRSLGVSIRHVSPWLHAASCELEEGLFPEVTELAFIQEIQPMLQLSPPPVFVGNNPSTTQLRRSTVLDYGSSYDQLAMINVPAVHDLGYTGSGVTVLIIDSGFYLGHESIRSAHIIDQYDFLFSDDTVDNEPGEDVFSQNNHGTSVLSVLGGYLPGRIIGPAYRANYLLAKTESTDFEDIVEEDNLVASLEWGVARGADIASISLGYLDWYTPDQMDGMTAITTLAVREATRQGLLVVAAAGNTRNDPYLPEWNGQVNAPADADSILSVGATRADSLIASFSSHGPTADGRIKPEVVAPGVNIYTASASGSQVYHTVSGTSVSTPLVAGVAAMILEAHPDWTPLQVREALMATAHKAPRPDNIYGWGIIDALAAIEYRIPHVNDPPYILRIYPNPFTAGVSSYLTIDWGVTLHVPVQAAIRLDLYDLLGRHLITLDERANLPLGLLPPIATAWRGTDKYGQPVPSGVYIIRLMAGVNIDASTLTIIH